MHYCISESVLLRAHHFNSKFWQHSPNQCFNGAWSALNYALCLLICGYFLSANELKQSADLSCSIIFLFSIFLSVGQFFSIPRTSIDSNGLPTDGLLAVGTVNFPEMFWKTRWLPHSNKETTGWLQGNRMYYKCYHKRSKSREERTSRV